MAGPKAVATTGIGKRIQERLGLVGWSLRRLAEEAGVSVSLLSRWSNEERAEKSTKHVAMVAAALGVSPHWLEYGFQQATIDFDPGESAYQRGLRQFLAGKDVEARVRFAGSLRAVDFAGANEAADIADALEARFAIDGKGARAQRLLQLDEDDDYVPPIPTRKTKKR